MKVNERGEMIKPAKYSVRIFITFRAKIRLIPLVTLNTIDVLFIIYFTSVWELLKYYLANFIKGNFKIYNNLVNYIFEFVTRRTNILIKLRASWLSKQITVHK